MGVDQKAAEQLQEEKVTRTHTSQTVAVHSTRIGLYSEMPSRDEQSTPLTPVTTDHVCVFQAEWQGSENS